MKITKNDGDHCVLSCLESFLADAGKPKSWQKISKIWESKGCCRPGGVVHVDPRAFIDGCALLGLNAQQVDFHYPIREEFRDGSLFILTLEPSCHCMRFYEYQSDTCNCNILVMDPNWKKDESVFEYHPIQEDEITRYKPPWYFRVTLAAP